jgi:aminopeptidase
MADVRLQRMAQVLLHHSIGLRPQDRLAIRAEPVALPLVREVVLEALRSGAFPEVFFDVPELKRLLLREGNNAQLTYIPPSSRLIAQEYETLLDIDSQENTRGLSHIDPTRASLHSRAQKDLIQTMRTRFNEGQLRRSMTLYPTNAYAQDAQMALSEFEDFFYHACFLDEEHPLESWHELSRQQERLVNWLKGKKQVHILGNDVDLTFSIEGRVFLNDDARLNFPGGEFFTGPVEDSAEGFIRFSFPSVQADQVISAIRLRFAHGAVVEAQAGEGQAYLEKMLELDNGAKLLGEFAFGNNPHINQCMKNILFDEKMHKTIHFALGAGFPATGSKNTSMLHWDMIYDLRAGCEVRVDGELFSKDGHFLLAEEPLSIY